MLRPLTRLPRSIRVKLALIVVAAVVSAMLIASALHGWRSADKRFHSLNAELDGVAATLATAVAPALASSEYHNVQKILRAIGRMPKVRFSRVVDTDGRLIASFGNGVVLARDAALLTEGVSPSLPQLLTIRTFPVDAPIIHGGVKVGTLHLVADVSELRGVLLESLISALFAGLVAAVVGLLVALRLEGTLTSPIIALTNAMRDVRNSYDFSRSVPKSSNDETGDLVDAFNDMLHEIRQRDAALARHREGLEQTVELRTRDLRVATEEAQKANAAKSEFLATMSHEIRTPMNGLLVMAELLTASNLPPRLQRYADVIVTSGRSLLSIINDILDFSKIEAGKLELEAVPVEPRKLVDDVTRLFGERASTKGLDIAAYVASDVPQIFAADPVRLNQILSNLVNNALKFTETGGVRVNVSCTPGSVSADRVRLRFAVTDTGIGIPKDKIATIFEAFSQADQTTTRRFGGTGIGLAVCQRLAQAMGGRIDVESSFGKGSTFALIASFEVLEPAQNAKAKPALKPAARKILLSIDAGPTRSALSAYARSFGYEPIFQDPHDSNGVLEEQAMAVIAPAESFEANSANADTNDNSFTIALSRFGDGAGEELVACGCVDAAISWPLGTQEADALFAALDAGDLSVLQTKDGTIDEADKIIGFPGARVLAADDSPVNREVLEEALSRMQVDVVHVENGKEALEAFKHGHFDLVFMDGSMPVMDGYQAAYRIRDCERRSARKRVPIVALTAHVIGSQAELWRKAGMDDCLTKPFTISSLESCLERWLGDFRAEIDIEVEDDVAEAEAVADDAPAPERILPNKRAGPDSLDKRISQAAQNSIDKMPLLDPEVIESISEMQFGNVDLVGRVVTLYRQHAPQALDALRFAWASKPDPAVAEAAHALKSLSRNVGAVQVSEICEAIEGQARGKILERDGKRLDQLEGSLVKTLAALPGGGRNTEGSARAPAHGA